MVEVQERFEAIRLCRFTIEEVKAAALVDLTCDGSDESHAVNAWPYSDLTDAIHRASLLR